MVSMVSMCACLAPKKVFLFGTTGVGKSELGNRLLENKKAFIPAKPGSVDSTTEKVSQSRSVIGELDLTVFDTPGLGDTKGRSTQFLNLMMERVQRERPHGFLFFVDGDKPFSKEIQHALEAFAHCMKPSLDSTVTLPPGRTLLVVNKLPAGGFGGGPSKEDLATKMHALNVRLTKKLGMNPLPTPHTFGFKRQYSDEGDKDFADNILALRAAIANLPDEPMPVHQFRTFKQVMDEANNLLRGAQNADAEAQRSIDTIQGDINWHNKRIKDLSTARAATSWIPFANIGTTIGFSVAIDHSKDVIARQQRRLAEVKADKNGNLKRKLLIANNWVREVRQVESANNR